LARPEKRLICIADSIQTFDLNDRLKLRLRALEEGDAGDAGGAGIHAQAGVFGGDAAEGEHGDADGGAGAAQPFEPVDRARIVLRERAEDRGEEGVAGAGAFGVDQLIERVAGDADEEAGGADGAPRGGRGRASGKVKSGGATGEGDVGAGVDEDFRGTGGAERLLDEMGEGARVEVFFADLDPIDTEAGVAFDDGEEGAGAAGGEAVSNVAADHSRHRRRRRGRGCGLRRRPRGRS